MELLIALIALIVALLVWREARGLRQDLEALGESVRALDEDLAERGYNPEEAAGK